MAQKQKSIPQKAVSGRKLSKKKIFFLGLLALALIGGLWYGWRVYQSHKRFAYAEQKKNEIVEELVKSLGDNVASTRVQNECFEAEQVPYFGGVLWCQTSTIIKLKTDIDYQTVGKTYLDIGDKYGKTYLNEQDIVQRYIVTLPNGVKCNLTYTNSEGKNYGNAMSIPFNGGEFPALAVACSGHAAAHHYPYSE